MRANDSETSFVLTYVNNSQGRGMSRHKSVGRQIASVWARLSSALAISKLKHGRALWSANMAIRGLNFILGVAIAGLFLPFPAEASETYTWQTVSESGASWYNGPLPDLVLTFSDAVVASGSYSFDEDYNGEPICTPGPTNLDGLQISRDVPGGYSNCVVEAYFDLTFDPDGTLSGGMNYLDLNAQFNLYGSGDQWSGTFNSDLLNCNYPPGYACQVTGYWQVPEPSTLALFGAGLFGFAGFAALRRCKTMTAA